MNTLLRHVHGSRTTGTAEERLPADRDRLTDEVTR